MLNRLPLPEGCQVEVPEAGEGGLIPEEVDPQDPLTPIDNLSTGRPS